MVKPLAQPIELTDLMKTDEDYFNDITRITNSHLKELEENGPLGLSQYFDDIVNGIKRESKPHQKLGSIIHCALLEPNKFESRYAVIDDRQKYKELSARYKNVRNTKEYSEWRSAESLKHEGKTVVELYDYDIAMRIRDRADQIESIRDIIKSCTHIESVFGSTLKGVPVKCKPDGANLDFYGLEVKSMEDAPSKRNVMREVTKWYYDRQVAFYSDITGVPTYFWLFVQKDKPYNLGLYEVSEMTINIGRRKYEEQLDDYKKYFGAGKSIDKNFYFDGEI